MKIRRDTRKKLLDLLEHDEKNTKKERLENLASDLRVTPEFAQNLLDGKELIDDELAKRIDEQLEKHDDDYSDLFDKKKLQKAFRKRIDPGVGRKIEEAWNERLKSTDEKIIVGDEIKNKIGNYGELNFYKKVLTPRDFNNSIYGLQEISNIPKLGEQVIVVDCNNGEKYPTHIQESQHSITTGLEIIWDKFNRRKMLKPGDIVGIALDPNNNHIIYVDFEYKYREKLDNQKKEDIQKDTKENTKYRRYEVAIEKSVPWIKEQIDNSKDGTIRMRTKDVAKEMGPEFESANLTSIYWGLKPALLHRHNIIIDQEIHNKSGDKLLAMRYRTEEDMPLSSPGKYDDGEILKVPSLKDLENDLKISKKPKELQKKVVKYDPEKEEELSQEKRRYVPRNVHGAVRDGSFRYRILNAYKETCAICGLQMNMVEACHIIPVEKDGTDEIINGIALCHNHHKAFDSGLIEISEKYVIMLNPSMIKDIKGDNISGGLDDFVKNSRIGEKIFLPDDDKFHPDLKFLAKRKHE